MAHRQVTSTSATRGARVATRLAGLGVAGVLAGFVAAPVAIADGAPSATDTTSDAAPPTDSGASSSGAPTDVPTDSSTPTGSSDTSSSSGPSESGSAASSSPATSAPAATSPATGGAPRTGSVKAQVAPAITPNFGTQKIRVDIALSDPAKFAPGTSLANSVIQAVETGDNAPATPQTCTTDATGACDFAGGYAGYYVAQPGDTVTFTQLTPPDGPGVLVDVPQVVGPCVIPQLTLDAVGTSNAAPPDYPDCPVTSQVFSAAHAQSAHPDLVDRTGIFDVAVTFLDPPAPPVAVDDQASVHTGSSVDVPVLANDVVYGLPATLDSVTSPAHGHAVVIGSHVSYTPDPGWGGTDTFNYTMHTVNGSSTARVTVDVVAPPIARDDSATTTAGDPGSAVVIPVLANDTANGGSPLVLAFGDPGHGTVQFAGSDELRYTPTGNFVGIDSFQYTITTPNGSSTATVRVTVTAPHAVAALADTGAQPEQLGTIGGLLLLAGGWTTWSGRRNRVRRAH